MDNIQKKKNLADEFNKNQTLIQQLVNRNQQIVGQFQILAEQEKENEVKPEGEEKK